MRSLLVVTPVLALFASGSAQIGVSVGYVSPEADDFGGTMGFGSHFDYVIPGTAFFIGVETGYWQRTEPASDVLKRTDELGNPMPTPGELKMSDLRVLGRVGWRVSVAGGTLVPYLGVAPGIHRTKHEGVFPLYLPSYEFSWTRFGVDGFGGAKIMILPSLTPFLIARYSVIDDPVGFDYNHFFVGVGVEFRVLPQGGCRCVGSPLRP